MGTYKPSQKTLVRMLNWYEDHRRSFAGNLPDAPVADMEFIKAAFFYDPYTAVENDFGGAWNDVAFCADVLWATEIDLREGAVLDRIPEDLQEAVQHAVSSADAATAETLGDDGAVSYEEWLALAGRNGMYLHYVPEDFKTAEMCLAAVRSEGEALKYAPTGLKTAELCLEAVKSNAAALQYTPSDLKTGALYLAAVEADADALHNVPQGQRTAQMCLAAVQRNGGLLRYVPDALKTAELCVIAVKGNSDAIRFVPESLKKEVEAAL